MYDYHEVAVLWEQWVEAHDYASAYVDNVIAHDDCVTYRFDGFLGGVVKFIDGLWYDLSLEELDHRHYVGCRTLEELWARHCEISYDPYECEVA
ncbi:MAG: hypothetical protein LPK02_07080 [Rhodobacterales bacterium]|nr:hypothetical protein [Rhodobacterales bacterium]